MVVIPAFNEASSIGEVIQRIPRSLDGIEEVFVVVIDDGSTDGTREIALRAGADRVLAHEINQGLGVAFRNGMNLALAMGADTIVNIDGDGQYDGREIPSLVLPILRGEADIVLGDRQIDKLNHMSFGRRLGNKIATFTVRTLSQAEVGDGQTGFRAFSRESAQRLNISAKYTHVHEVIIQAAKLGLRVKSVPVRFAKRDGESRLIKSFWSYTWRAGGIMLRTYMQYEPLKTFSIAGLIFLALAFLFGIRVLVHYTTTGMVSPFLPSAIVAAVAGIIGLQFIILGLVGEVIARNRELTEEALYRLKKLESDLRLEDDTWR